MLCMYTSENVSETEGEEKKRGRDGGEERLRGRKELLNLNLLSPEDFNIGAADRAANQCWTNIQSSRLSRVFTLPRQKARVRR